jgi:hypothetical protein
MSALEYHIEFRNSKSSILFSSSMLIVTIINNKKCIMLLNHPVLNMQNKLLKY